MVHEGSPPKLKSDQSDTNEIARKMRAPCLEYLPTFTIDLSQTSVNIPVLWSKWVSEWFQNLHQA